MSYIVKIGNKVIIDKDYAKRYPKRNKMTPEQFKEHMAMCERICFCDPHAGMQAAFRFMSEALVDEGFHEGVLILKRMIDEEETHRVEI